MYITADLMQWNIQICVIQGTCHEGKTRIAIDIRLSSLIVISIEGLV